MIGDWDALAELFRGRRCGRGRNGIAEDGECWVFAGARDRGGYGCVNRGTYRGRAHRYAWMELVGEIPDGLCVLHYCDNPACVRLDHLWLGTHTDNMRDMMRKGRANLTGPMAYNAARATAARRAHAGAE